ncbi:TetR family transcriptional regulator C-terminal domain-containing protein [Saccharothrix deserti]|uniref:TetR family transcriptional regulator C-terminal domain-containing protein n=1 Tax=Saccharothrix deserti TaxID=2593674 RepID=UPI001EE4AF2B|nr:TetR family transcriptional regulator [Saccharothrix deserti]
MVGQHGGVEGLATGRLAAEIGMSKAGVLGHFGTKESLQLAVVGAAAAEFDGRSGPVRDAIAGMDALWQRDLRIHIRRAVSDGDLPPDTDADQLVCEIAGIMLALNHFLQLQRDRLAPARARRALHRLLGT